MTYIYKIHFVDTIIILDRKIYVGDRVFLQSACFNIALYKMRIKHAR